MHRKISLRFKILIKKSDWWNLINYACGFCCVVIYYEIYIIVKTKVEKKSLYVAMCLIFVQKSSVKHVYDYATLLNFYMQFSTR